MSHKKEFLPTTRQGRLDMGIVWLHYLAGEVKNEKGVMVPRWKLWGIPEEVFSGFGKDTGSAEEAITKGKDAEKRTDVINTRIKETFRTLVSSMRQLKNRFFHMPPLTEEDFAALLLNVPASTRVITGEPTAQAVVETFLVGRHQLGIRIRYVSGDPNDKANKSYRIYYKLVAHGEKPPETLTDFSMDFPERRRNFVRDFGFENSGKTVYFYVRIENGRKVGPAGSITSALLP